VWLWIFSGYEYSVGALIGFSRNMHHFITPPRISSMRDCHAIFSSFCVEDSTSRAACESAPASWINIAPPSLAQPGPYTPKAPGAYGSNPLPV